MLQLGCSLIAPDALLHLSRLYLTGCPSSKTGGPASYHYDWAAQLARTSPGSRSTALGAMAEDDRLAVQVGRGV